MLFAGSWVVVAAISGVFRSGSSEYEAPFWHMLVGGLVLTFVFYLPLGLLPFLFGQGYEEPGDWRIEGARPWVWGAVVLGVGAFVFWFVTS